MYAGANRGAMPTPVTLAPMGTGVLTPECSYQVGQGNPTTSTYGFGLLYSSKFITSAKVFYCVTQPRIDFDYYSYPQPWLYATLSAGTWDTWRTSYLYAPHVDVNGKFRYPKFQQVPKDRCLALDVCFETASTSHLSRSGPSWNLVFKDGHVVTAISKFCYDAMGGKYQETRWAPSPAETRRRISSTPERIRISTRIATSLKRSLTEEIPRHRPSAAARR